VALAPRVRGVAALRTFRGSDSYVQAQAVRFLAPVPSFAWQVPVPGLLQAAPVALFDLSESRVTCSFLWCETTKKATLSR
jgi:hypothetical protein